MTFGSYDISFFFNVQKITIRVHEWNDEGSENDILQHPNSYANTERLVTSRIYRFAHVQHGCVYEHPFQKFNDYFFLNFSMYIILRF